MDYPLEILPNPTYKIIDCDLRNYYLLRFTNTSDLEEIWDKETNTIKLEHIYSPSIRVSDLSMNLLGIFKTSYIFLAFTDEGAAKYMNECLPDEQIEPPIFQTDYFQNTNRHYWCIQIHHLANERFEYKIGNDTFVVTCLIVHTPMQWNFWHISLRWRLDAGLLEDLGENQKKKIAKRMEHTVKSRIVQFARIEEPAHEILPQECYCKN